MGLTADLGRCPREHPRMEIHILSINAACIAPGVDTVTIRYHRAQAEACDDFTLLVYDCNGVLVYQQDFNAVPPLVQWNGSNNQAPNTPYVSPRGSPYRIRCYGTARPQQAPQSGVVRFFGSIKEAVSTLIDPLPVGPAPTREVAVRYHSLALSLGDWLPAEEVTPLDQYVNPFAPNFNGINLGDARTVRWVWYQLSKQGYHPGPDTSNLQANTPLSKAIRRFRQAVPELRTRLYQRNANDGEYEIDANANAAAQQIDAAFLQHLHAGTHARLRAGGNHAAVIESVGVFNGSQNVSALFVDIDRFYIGGAETNNNQKAAVDAAWVPRPLVPVRATIYLEDRAGQPVAAPHPSALGDYRVQWTWADRAQVTTSLPESTPGRPSRTKNYVDRAIADVAHAVASNYHNARTAVGGTIAGAPADALAAFAPCAAFQNQSANAPFETWSPVNAAHASEASRTCVLFHPSNIAGDNYKLTATLDRAAWTVPQTNAHANRPLEATTGEIQVWRRVPIAAYLKWGNVRAITDWAPIRAHFAKAFVSVEKPKWEGTVAGLPNAAKQILQTAVNNSYAGQTIAGMPQVSSVHANNPPFTCQFDENFVFPDDPRSLEHRNIEAIGVNQFADPSNIINELMIGLLRPEMSRFRAALNPIPRDKPTLARLTNRLAMAQAWAASNTAWVAAVGGHFVNALAPLLNNGALVTPACPADRFIAPIAAAALQNAPATRAEILDELLFGGAQAALNAWVGLNAPQQADITALTLVSRFLAQIKKDIADALREGFPVHPVLRRALVHGVALLHNRVGKPVSGMNPAITLKNHHIEIWVRTSALVTLQQALVPFNVATTTANVANTTWTLVNVTHGNNPGNFDPVAFGQALQNIDCAYDILRGNGAAVPTFRVPQAREDEIDRQHREALIEAEKFTVIGRLGGVYPVFTDIVMAIDDAVHDASVGGRPAGGLVVCHYASNPSPLPVRVGLPGDLPNVSNSTSMGLDAGVAFVSNDQPLAQDHLFAHELSHCMFFRHWQKGEDGILQDFSIFEDHDIADSNCIMSYSAFDRTTCHTHFETTAYKPHFCGKCNLKLRGWNLQANQLPRSSFDLVPKFPNVSGGRQNPASTDTVDIVQADQTFRAMTGNLLPQALPAPVPTQGAFPDHDSMRFFSGGVLQQRNGVSFFARTAIAVTQLPTNTVLQATAHPWEHGAPGQGTITDAQLLYSPNTHFHAAWEENLEWHVAKGGATNTASGQAPPASHIVYNTTSALYYDPSTLLHELVHFYQSWDATQVYEGIDELFAGMLTNRFNAHYNNNVTAWGINPSYLQMTQFVVHELLPRLGIDGVAHLFFADQNSNILGPILKPGVTPKDFNDRCKECIADHDMGEAAALLIPRGSRPSVRAPNQALDAVVTQVVGQVEQYLANHAPNGVPNNNYALIAALLRLKLKSEVWNDLVTEATAFRTQINDTDRVHRLERFIEEKKTDMVRFKAMYVAFGGQAGDLP